jgi:hypothetical protein
MTKRRVEQILRDASVATPFYEKYVVLKQRLLDNEYQHWAARFTDGNNHGPGHIERDLDNLDRLLGDRFLEDGLITLYELFLAMMSILYHDVGILAGRKGHADTSAKFFDEEGDTYIFETRDRDIIRAAVVSHSASKDIEEECSQFSPIEYFGSESARPRVVAALVRLADELDEDHRRASPVVAKRIGIAEGSEFYWAFCNRILAVVPLRESLEIHVDVKFEADDGHRIVLLEGSRRLFIPAFAEKLAKINKERVITTRFLPEALRYRRLVVSVKPLPGDPQWKSPREFLFTNATEPSEFTRAVPELSVRPTNESLQEIAQQMRTGQLDAADAGLKRLEDVLADLPIEPKLRTLWNSAVVWSLRAALCASSSKEQSWALGQSLDFLKRWYESGLASGWDNLGLTAQNEVYKVATDGDIGFLYNARAAEIRGMLGENQSFLIHTSRGGGGGCVAAGSSVEVPGGSIRIEELRPGTTILSANLETPPKKIHTKVIQLHHFSESVCVQVNNQFVFTASQPLYVGSGQWVLAKDLVPGTQVQDADGRPYMVTTVETVMSPVDSYTVTTDHPSHNFLVSGIVCRNKKQ